VRAYIHGHAIILSCIETTMKPPRRGAKPLAQFMPAIIGEALAARGLSEASLVSDWPAIVGETIARYARPIQLQWPPRAVRRDPEMARPSSTLVLRVDGAFALEIQHSAAIIAERVNAHLGWRCVDRIAFRQGPLPPVKDRHIAETRPSAEAEAESRSIAAPIEDDGLREALTRLGARAIDGSARRLAGGRLKREKAP
jgi:hypothetical protein